MPHTDREPSQPTGEHRLVPVMGRRPRKRMSKDQRKTLGLGVILGILPSIGLAWAFATTAADHQLKPHLADAAAKVRLMCVLAEWQAEAVEAQCHVLGAKCPVRPPELHPTVLAKACDGGG